MFAIVFIIVCGAVCLGSAAATVGAIIPKNRSFLLAAITLIIAIVAGCSLFGIVDEWQNYNDVKENRAIYMDEYVERQRVITDLEDALKVVADPYVDAEITELTRIVDLVAENEGLQEKLGVEYDNYLAEKEKCEPVRIKLSRYETFTWMFQPF